jgi:hypothetical protein
LFKIINMKLYSVAIGSQYEKEAERLVRTVGQPVDVFTKNNNKYVQQDVDALIDGLYHKSNFANYIEETDGPIIFMDADMFTLKENPFSDFSVESDIDIAYVPYSGRWFLPDDIRQSAVEYHGHKINSGFLYFKNLATAKLICSQWRDEYLERCKLYIHQTGNSKYEYDEWALMIALQKTQSKVQILDKKWNEWELKTEEEIKESNCVFIQHHDFLNIDKITNI